MAGMRVFMKIEGMPGSSLESNRADWCDVRGFSHELKYPYDMAQGRGTGSPTHGACQILKEIDKASPKLYEALAKNLKVNKVELDRDVLPGFTLRYTATMQQFDRAGASTLGTVELLDPARPGEAPVEIGRIDLMFSHIDQNMAGIEFPEHNFVFSDSFRTLLRSSGIEPTF